MDDRELVQGLLSGNEASGRLFDETYRPRMKRIATYILGYQDSDVEDMVQETLLEAYKDLPRFGFHCELYKWIRRICVFRCFERLRQRKRLITAIDGEFEKLIEEESKGIEEEKERNETRNILRGVADAGLEKLGKLCRELLELREKQGKTYGELSSRFQIPIGTVTSRLIRCREKLLRIVKKAARSRGLLDE